MAKTRLAVIGGFLGAGKTTSIVNIAKHFINDGRKIGIVTNDQGSQLVDTSFMASQGLPVLEVTGGCFCTHFDEFTDRISRLAESEMPDIILAEPIGSSVDLIATIFKPLQSQYTRKFSLSPLSVVVDPKRVKRLMMEKDLSLYSNEINYLFAKQLEEADIIVINKTDILMEQDIDLMKNFFREKFPGADVIAVSAKENTGFEEWIQLINGLQAPEKNPVNIDRDISSAAQGSLSWLNASALLKCKGSFNVNTFIDEFMAGVKNQLIKGNHEIGHLKIYCVSDNDWAKASLTSIMDELDYSRMMQKEVGIVNLLINARVNMEPSNLRVLMEYELRSVCTRWSLDMEDLKTECFKPVNTRKEKTCSCKCKKG